MLEEICRLVERTVSESLCEILLIDPIANQVRHGAAPNLPQSYNEAMNGLPVNPRTGPCAMAACIKAQVIASDIAADPRWDPSEWRTLAIAIGLRSCWSAPIFSANGNVLGTFAIYSRKPRSPSLQQHKMIEQITNLTSIAIERSRNSTALRESEEQIRRSEQQYRQIVEAIPQFISVIAHDGSFLYSNKLVCDYTGLSDEDFRTTDFRSRIYHPEDTERTFHLRQQASCGAFHLNWNKE